MTLAAPFAMALVSSFTAILGGLAFSTVASASDYPPDYVVESECKDVGPAVVCALNRRHGIWPRLSITYKGGLMASQWGRISAYVELNGRSGTFSMTNANFSESVTLGGPRNVTRCVPADSASVGRPYPACAVNSPNHYNYDLPLQAESDLFFFARNNQGMANAWDVELAFVAQDGSWDSAGNGNYRVRFE
jgi:hypothetical protein